MGPLDRFNDRAKRVLALAQVEAIRFNHSSIGPEHLLLGLASERESVAGRALESLGLDLSRLRTAVESNVGRGTPPLPPEIALTPSTRKVLELADDESRALGHSHVGSQHLLLGIVREGGTMAITVLTSLGVTREKVREAVGKLTPPST